MKNNYKIPNLTLEELQILIEKRKKAKVIAIQPPSHWQERGYALAKGHLEATSKLGSPSLFLGEFRKPKLVDTSTDGDTINLLTLNTNLGD